ncbi:hypothetical protein Bca52824_045508 [Brassica carinata]|uniref:Uncharacterized protein n=1 Tax=Brassica carinata TaxID=52824 RepID=A0A8X7RB75_BRACI|nr:hypothetical protein Bca52824_045508 [Brassica carinata]
MFPGQVILVSLLSSQAIPVLKQPSMLKNYTVHLIGIVGDSKAMEIIGNALVVISAGPNDLVLKRLDSFVRLVSRKLLRFNCSVFYIWLVRFLSLYI